MRKTSKSWTSCVRSRGGTAASSLCWTLTPPVARAEPLWRQHSGQRACMRSSPATWHMPQPPRGERLSRGHGLSLAPKSVCTQLPSRCRCRVAQIVAVHDRHHEVGNLGVEHCSIDAIQAALQSARPSQPNRTEFSRDDLVQWGLLTPMNQTPGSNRAPDRRSLVGLLLGFGACDAKQMLVQLNKYGFGRNEVEFAVHTANQMLDSGADDVIAKAPRYAAVSRA